MCLVAFFLSAQPITKVGNVRGKLEFLHHMMYSSTFTLLLAWASGQFLLPGSQRVLDLSHFWVGPDNEDTIQGVMS